MSNDFTPIPEKMTITIFHDQTSAEIPMDVFEELLINYMKELFDISLIGSQFGMYINAFEWLLANLTRTSGIQLYTDGEIRINIIPSMINDGKKCLFLKEDAIDDRTFDSKLYGFLLLVSLLASVFSKQEKK